MVRALIVGPVWSERRTLTMMVTGGVVMGGLVLISLFDLFGLRLVHG